MLPIKKFAQLKNGSLLVMCSNNEDVKRVQNLLQENLAQNFEMTLQEAKEPIL